MTHDENHVSTQEENLARIEGFPENQADLLTPDEEIDESSFLGNNTSIGKTVLAIDDKSVILKTYKLYFKHMDPLKKVKLVTQINPHLVFGDIEDFNPNLIILDWIMPHMDGIKVLEKIRSNPNWKDIPVMMATSVGQKKNIVEAIKLGASDYIVKPIDKHVFTKKVVQLLKLDY